MGLARDVERRLEGLVEGFFTRLFRSGLQPVEVGRRIVREMGENKTVSVNRIYAPNDFRVFIGPEDHERFGPMEPGLVREFSDLVIDTAKKNRWNLMGAPRIAFAVDHELGRGEFQVDASLTADAGAPAVSTRAASDEDASSTRAISTATAERLGLSQAGPALVVLDESGGAKERISITRAPVTIGRLSTNDVVLSDPNVSRRHAELRRDGESWTIADLGSTNGTLVNGKDATDRPLSHGDRISFGTSELRFELPKDA
ncbi:MAG TPA: DUF3662 and FHA domain-containing protein [Actinomycetota bacterium]|nr:DUF3662 and FHA domain-containing protein [Actinomycetota bacterium]